MVINRYSYQIHFIIHFGGMKLIRNKQDHVINFAMENSEKHISTEAPIYIEIDRLADEKAMVELQSEIDKVLYDVRVSVADWRKMVNRVENCLNELETHPPSLDLAELAETRDFLRWL